MAKKKPKKKILKILIETEPSPKVRKPYIKVLESKHSQLTYENVYSSGNKNKKGEKWKPSTITDGIAIPSVKNKTKSSSSTHVHPRAYNDTKVPDFFIATCIEYNKSRDLYQFIAKNGKEYYLAKSKCQNQALIQKGKEVKVHVLSQTQKYRVVSWDWK